MITGTSVIKALESWRQDGQGEANMAYIARPCLKTEKQTNIAMLIT